MEERFAENLFLALPLDSIHYSNLGFDNWRCPNTRLWPISEDYFYNPPYV